MCACECPDTGVFLQLFFTEAKCSYILFLDGLPVSLSEWSATFFTNTPDLDFLGIHWDDYLLDFLFPFRFKMSSKFGMPSELG